MKIKRGFSVGFIIKYWPLFWIKEAVPHANASHSAFVL